MVNMTLNIQLTDEQYADLMSRSFDAVMSDPTVIEKLKSTITIGMSCEIEKVIKENAPDVIKCIYELSGYSSQSIGNSFIEYAVREASKDFQDKIKNTIQNVMCDMAEKADVGKIIYRILAASIMDGATAGIRNWQNIVSNNSNAVLTNLQMINSVLANAGRPIDPPYPGIIPPETPSP